MSEELEQFKNKFSKLVEDEKYSELLAISETKLEELNKTAPDDKEFLAYIYFSKVIYKVYYPNFITITYTKVYWLFI